MTSASKSITGRCLTSASSDTFAMHMQCAKPRIDIENNALTIHILLLQQEYQRQKPEALFIVIVNHVVPQGSKTR